MSAEQQRALQQLSAEQQIVSSNIELIKQRMELTQAYIRDQRTGLKTLEELESRAAGEEILLHVGGGLLIEAKITDPNKVIRDIGSGVRVESTLTEAKEKASEIIKRLEEQYNNLAKELEKLGSHAADVDARLRQLLADIRSGEK